MKTHQASIFHSTYDEARAAFLAQCKSASLPVDSLQVEGRGPEGEQLYTDLAILGPENASNILVLVSGTHGPEGVTGSACQCDFLQHHSASDLPHDTAILFVHMLNAFGAANRTRWTEENVDLNRNFIDFDSDIEVIQAENGDYARIHSRLVDIHARAESSEFAHSALAILSEEFGLDALSMALFRGQYFEPDGIGYGGNAPTKARERYETALQRYARSASNLAVVDYHTGLGQRGEGLILSMAPDGDPTNERIQTWFSGEALLVNTPSGGIPYVIAGDLCQSGSKIGVPGSDVTGVVLEYGTYDVDRLLLAALSDFSVRFAGQSAKEGPRSGSLELCQQDVHDFFYIEAADWQARVLERSRWLTSCALSNLTTK